MKKGFVGAAIVLFSLMLPQTASAAGFSKIYAFGDSLTDTGNSFAGTGSLIPPSPPYFQGRFSNGPVWIEYLTSELGLGLTNFATGGATTGNANVLVPGGNPFNLPGLEQQIQNFKIANPIADANALYVLWAGANDYLGGRQTNPAIPVSNLATAVTSLASAGAKNFLVANLPDLGKVPAANSNATISAGLNALSGGHNFGLSQALASLDSTLNVNIKSLDVNTLVNQAIANSTQFGFTNVTDACLNLNAGTICSNPNEYLFWDNLHPTTNAHSLIAKTALVEIPEPSVGLGILALSAVSAVGMLKRNNKQILN